MGRVLTALVVLVAGVQLAAAAPKRKVKVESTPPGATVYINSREDGPVCDATPCTVEVPVGESTLIIELPNHAPELMLLTVNARKAPPAVKVTLVPAVGTIVIEGPEGASVRVDDEDKGTAPTRVDVEAGPHRVELTLDGKTDTQIVEVETGAEATVVGELEATGGGGGGGGDTDGGGDGDTLIVDDVDKPDPPAKGPARATPYVSVAAAMDVGFRRFEYDAASDLASNKENGQVLLGPIVEVWPGTLAGVRALRGLSLLVRFGYGVNPQRVRDKDTGMVTDASTFWRTFEASARHRWTVRGKGGLEIGAGFVRDQHQFSGERDDIAKVPDADYQAVRIGVRGSVMLGKLEPYLVLENRIVLSGGPLAARFMDGAEASGLRGAVGAMTAFGPIRARLEGSLTRYSWTFKTDGQNDPFVASSGIDSIRYVSVSIGYAY